MAFVTWKGKGRERGGSGDRQKCLEISRDPSENGTPLGARHLPCGPVRVLSVLENAFQLLHLLGRELHALGSWLRGRGGRHEGHLGQLLPGILVATSALAVLVDLVLPVGFAVDVAFVADVAFLVVVTFPLALVVDAAFAVDGTQEARVSFLAAAFFCRCTPHALRSYFHFAANFHLAEQAGVIVVDPGRGLHG